MDKYMELLLDLLEIEKKEQYLNIAKIIELNNKKDICVYHQHSFIFEGYKKLLNGEIGVEDFLQLGDFQSKIYFDEKKVDSISYLKINPVFKDNVIYIFDSVSKGIIGEMENIYYC